MCDKDAEYSETTRVRDKEVCVALRHNGTERTRRDTVCCHLLLGAVGRFIRRRPSQQQIRARSEDSEASKCKLQRSQSERVLGTKMCDSEEDGFSVQEITASFGMLTNLSYLLEKRAFPE